MSDYLLGLLTLPALALLAAVLFVLYVVIEVLAETKLNITWAFRRKRDVAPGRGKYIRDGDEWRERRLLLLFFGHWRRSQKGYTNRWIGFGHPNGTSFIIFRATTNGATS